MLSSDNYLPQDYPHQNTMSWQVTADRRCIVGVQMKRAKIAFDYLYSTQVSAQKAWRDFSLAALDVRLRDLGRQIETAQIRANLAAIQRAERFQELKPKGGFWERVFNWRQS